MTLTSGRLASPLAFGSSLALHAALFAALLAVRPPGERRAEPVEVEIVETAPPPPPPREPPPAPEPAPRPVRPAPRVTRVAPPPEAPAARREVPPPPNAPSPADAKPAPVRIGISMESTTTAGGVAAPVGNTLYGRAPRQAPEPAAVQPYGGERFAPPSQVTSLPVPLESAIPRSEYPEEARRLGIEGEVKLRLLVDEQGRVREARVLRDPGHGFAEVAVRAAKRYLRFRPAQRGGEAVATEIPYTIRFEL